VIAHCMTTNISQASSIVLLGIELENM
jgi:hypothetical protein